MERIVERVDFSIPAQPRVLRVCAYAPLNEFLLKLALFAR